MGRAANNHDQNDWREANPEMHRQLHAPPPRATRPEKGHRERRHVARGNRSTEMAANRTLLPIESAPVLPHPQPALHFSPSSVLDGDGTRGELQGGRAVLTAN